MAKGYPTGARREPPSAIVQPGQCAICLRRPAEEGGERCAWCARLPER